MPRKGSSGFIPPLVEVVWIDACGYDSVHGTLGHVLDHAKLVARRTAGYLLHEDDKRTVLAHDYDRPIEIGDEAEFGNITVIPSGWVVKISRKTRKVLPPKSTTETVIDITDPNVSSALTSGGKSE